MPASVEASGSATATGGIDFLVAASTIGVYIARFDLRTLQAGDTMRVWARWSVDEGAGPIPAVLNTEEIVGPLDDGSDGCKQVVELGPLVVTSNTADGNIGLYTKQTVVGTLRTYFWELIKVV